MGVLTLASGLNIPVRAETLQRETREIGDRATAYDGTMRLTRRARKVDFAFEMPPMSAADAFAWEHLLAGTGQYWSFDSTLYSTKGVPSTGTAVRTPFGPKAGVGCLDFGIAQTFIGALGDEFALYPWTVSLWRNAGAGYVHYVVRSDGAKWVDGVRNDLAVTTWMAVTTSLTITDTGVPYDSIHAALGLWPEDWITPVYDMAGAAWANFPALSLYGDALPGSSTSARRTYLAEVSSSPIFGGRLDGASYSASLHQLSVSLMGV
jgi:hypothetical protein